MERKISRQLNSGLKIRHLHFVFGSAGLFEGLDRVGLVFDAQAFSASLSLSPVSPFHASAVLDAGDAGLASSATVDLGISLEP